MATPPTINEQALRKLEDQLTCGICLDSYTEPKLLQCFHVFCKQCLERLVVRDRQGLSLHCPSAVAPPSSHQLLLQACKPHFILSCHVVWHIHHFMNNMVVRVLELCYNHANIHLCFPDVTLCRGDCSYLSTWPAQYQYEYLYCMSYGNEHQYWKSPGNESPCQYYKLLEWFLRYCKFLLR